MGVLQYSICSRPGRTPWPPQAQSLARGRCAHGGDRRGQVAWMWESGPSWSIMPCPLLIVTQVTHGYLTPSTLLPLDQHLLAPHLIHGTVEQHILVLLLLLTNLPSRWPRRWRECGGSARKVQQASPHRCMTGARAYTSVSLSRSGEANSEKSLPLQLTP